MTKYYSRSNQKFVDIEQMPDQYVRNAFVKMCKTETSEDAIFAFQQKDRADDLDNKNYDLVNANKNLSSRIDVILKENEEVHLENQSLMKQLDQEVRNDTQEGKIVPLVQENLSLARQRDSWKEKSMNMMERSSYDELQLENVRLVAQLEHDEHQVGKCEELTKENAELKFQIQQVDRNQTVSKEAYDIAWQNMELWKKRHEIELNNAEYWKSQFYKKVSNVDKGE